MAVFADRILRQSDAERLAQQKKAKRFKTVKEPREKDADTKALERDLTVKLGLKTEIAFDGRSSLLAIPERKRGESPLAPDLHPASIN